MILLYGLILLEIKMYVMMNSLKILLGLMMVAITIGRFSLI